MSPDSPPKIPESSVSLLVDRTAATGVSLTQALWQAMLPGTYLSVNRAVYQPVAGAVWGVMNWAVGGAVWADVDGNHEP